MLCFSPLSVSRQPQVVVTLNVTSPDLFHIVFRYVNRGPANVKGRVSVLEEGKFNICGNCKCIFHFSTNPKQPTFCTTAPPCSKTPPLGTA